MGTRKYQIAQTCYWNNRLWKPEITYHKGEDAGIVFFDSELDGEPPKYFTPLDGNAAPERTTAPADDGGTGPQTLSELQASKGRPLGVQTGDRLSARPVSELRDLADARGIDGARSMRKDALIAALRSQAENEVTAATAPDRD